MIPCYDCSSDDLSDIVLGHGYRTVLCFACGACNHIGSKKFEHHWTNDGEFHIRKENCVLVGFSQPFFLGETRFMAELTDKQRRKHCNLCFIAKKNHPEAEDGPRWWAESYIRPHEFVIGEPSKKRRVHFTENYREPLCLDVLMQSDYVFALTSTDTIVTCEECRRRRRRGFTKKREKSSQISRFKVKWENRQLSSRTRKRGKTSSGTKGTELGKRKIRISRLRHRR